MQRLSILLRPAFRIVAVLAMVAGVTAADILILHFNSAAAGFSFLVLVLGCAAWFGLRESLIASLASVACYNFFFLPPAWTFNIADPQNWIALLAFLVTAITASRLSYVAKRRANEARARQEELQQMYNFSRGLMLGSQDRGFARQVVGLVIENFAADDTGFYELASGTITKAGSRTNSPLEDHLLSDVASHAKSWHDPAGSAFIVPVRLGGEALGSLGVAGKDVPSELAIQSIAQLIAIAIERARVEELSKRMELAKENEALKATLLDALAHEFKTPLTSIKAAVTTLLTSSLSVLDQSDLLNVVDEQADRMTVLVNDSIELARLGSAQRSPHIEACDPEQMVRGALRAMRGLLEGRTVDVQVPSSLSLVAADKNLTELALRQVIDNALKYSPEDSAVLIRLEEQEKLLAIRVSNGGTGIAQADQPHIFEKFYRASGVRSQVPGTGLGLSITRQIIQSEGGTIVLEPESSQGTTFSITLPLAHAYAAAPLNS